MTTLRRISRDFLQSLFPELCLYCGEKIVDRDFFCGDCAPRNGFTTPATENPQYKQHYTFAYEGPLQTLFQTAKFSGRRRARRYFTAAAALDLGRVDDDKTRFLSLPSRSDFLEKLLSEAIAPQKLITGAFKVQNSRVGSQANKNLGEAARYRRIHETLQWAGLPLPPAERYILCDDVSTTGATLGHAAYLLQSSGITANQIVLWSLMYRPRFLKNPVG